MKVIEIKIGDDKPNAIPLDGAMRVGDTVEFLSDRQTEKGPSSGIITKVNGPLITIKHSDHPGQEFYAPNLRIKGEVRHSDGLRKLWLIS